MYRILNHTANEGQDGHRMSYQVCTMPMQYIVRTQTPSNLLSPALKCDERDTAWLIDFALNHF